MSGGYSPERTKFERVIRAMEADIANAGAHLGLDARARLLYQKQIHAIATELRSQAGAGKITWQIAAEQAAEARNVTMEVIRSRTTPVGRAFAERMKLQGKTFNEIVAKKTMELFGSDAKFAALNQVQQNQVYARVVASAGKSNPRITGTMLKLSRAGRGLLFLSVAISVYRIAEAEDKESAAAQEIAVTGAGIGGGIAGGALAGLACGPGAPVCVTIGAFAGGALAAFGVDLFW